LDNKDRLSTVVNGGRFNKIEKYKKEKYLSKMDLYKEIKEEANQDVSFIL